MDWIVTGWKDRALRGQGLYRPSLMSLWSSVSLLVRIRALCGEIRWVRRPFLTVFVKKGSFLIIVLRRAMGRREESGLLLRVFPMYRRLKPPPAGTPRR